MRHVRHRSHTALAAVWLLGALVMLAPEPAVAAPTTVADLQADIAAAEEAASSASDRALVAEAHAADARALAQAAQAALADLTAQTAAAEEASRMQRQRFGAVASGLYRTAADGPLLAELLVAAEPDDLLSRLSVLERVTASSARAAAAARQSADVVAGLRAQAEAAAAASEERAAEADAAAAAARAEADAEAIVVADARRTLDAAYARLAAARGTTSTREKQAHLAEKVAQDASAPAGAAGGGSATPAPPVDAPAPAGAPAMTPAQAQSHARGAVAARGWDGAQFSCLVSLWNRESGWRWDALNRSSGAYGIPQALPGAKMASAGADWRTSAATQISWGLAYIAARYGSPCGAWDHSQRTGWY